MEYQKIVWRYLHFLSEMLQIMFASSGQLDSLLEKWYKDKYDKSIMANLRCYVQQE